MNRRDFIKLSLQVLIASSLSSAARAVSVSPKNTQTGVDVIIIGAGISGISAAVMLKSKGYRVLILEARNRIGGRIWTDNTLNVPLDLGASWIHGVTNNPIKQLADKFNLKTVPTDYDARQIYQANGTLLTEEDVTDLTDRYDGVYGRIIAIQKKRRSGNLPDISWQAALEQELVNEKFTPAELTELYYSLNTELEHEYAADLSQLSLLNSDVEENAFEGGDHLFLKGYGQIIEQLVQSATLSSDILINQIVKSVDYSKTTSIKVTTNQAVFQARAVLVTLPLGVLKANTVKFSPPLPITKQNSIKKLGFGVLNKTYLRFPEYFWEDQDAESQLVNSISTIKGHFAEWLNLYFYTKQPILLGFNAAKHGKEIEGMSDKAIIAEWMQTLRAIYGNDIPEPDSYLITRWNKDPYALGSYSYVGVGASAKDYQELAKSVNNQLFFAGEATSFDHPATVHGAFLSGEREAKKIIAAIPVTGK